MKGLVEAKRLVEVKGLVEGKGLLEAEMDLDVAFEVGRWDGNRPCEQR